MTSIKMLGSRGLLLGLALLLLGTNLSPGQPSRPQGVDLLVIDSKGDGFGKVVRNGDHFVALDCRKGATIGFLGNFNPSVELLWVDNRYLGYDLRGKNKNVLVRELRGQVRARDLQDVEWDLVLAAKEPFKGRFRVKNGEMKGWWIGLGPVEKGEEEARLPRERLPRAPLVLVKDKKDAAGFDWEDPKDDGR
jgi:hypothetical protein